MFKDICYMFLSLLLTGTILGLVFLIYVILTY